MKNFKFYLALLSVLCFSSLAQAVDVVSGAVGPSSLGNIPVMTPTAMPALAGDSTVQQYTVDTVSFSTSCTASSLRQVPNPAHPSASTDLTFSFGAGKFVRATFSNTLYLGRSTLIQADAVDDRGEIIKSCDSSLEQFNSDSLCAVTSTAGAFQLFLKKGEFLGSAKPSLAAVQTLHPVPGPFQGREDVLSTNDQVRRTGPTTVSAHMTVTGALGQGVGSRVRGGFCGSYYSPIMLSFKGRYPEVLATSKFPVHPYYKKTHWPSKYNGNYLLAYDKNKDGLITDQSEIFGDAHGRYENGFEHLKSLDSNKDGQIDAGDAKFAELKLWQDKNADGIGQASELQSLASKKVVWISLNYDKKNLVNLPNARLRESSVFSYKNAGGKQVLAKANDYWFKPAGDLFIPMTKARSLSSTQNK